MLKMPDQEIFDEIYKLCKSLLSDTYDVRPMTEVNYPFIDLGGSQLVNRPTKTAIKGSVIQEVNVWGTVKQRKQVSDLIHQIFLEAVKIRHTPNYAVSVDIQQSNIQMQDDTSTNTRLIRGILELTIQF